jgi:hypothetical protein
MDTGAQPDAPDTGAPASGAGTTEDAGAGNKSTGIEKGKVPKVPEVQTDPTPASAGQATLATPEQPTPKAPTAEKIAVPAKANHQDRDTVCCNCAGIC